MATDAPQLAGDVLGREDEVHHAGGRRAARHPGILRRALVLGERDAALGLDGLQTQDAIGGGSRKDHADGLVLLILRERAQEDVHGHVLPAGVGAWHQVQDAAADGQVPVRRDDVHLIGFDPDPFSHLRNRHGRGSGKDLGQQALVLRVEMLYQDERHARVGGDIAEQ